MQNADLILIPLLNGAFSLAQVDRVENSTARLFMTTKTATPTTQPKPLSPDDVVATITVNTDTINWVVIGYDALPRFQLVDTPPQDPAIAEALANALHGLYPWDAFPDPGFFTSFLRDPASLPANVRHTADFPTSDT